jgi:hypothetical protein
LVKQAKLCNHGQGKGKLLKNAVARVENGHFYGMGYFSDGGFTDPSGIRIMSLLTIANQCEFNRTLKNIRAKCILNKREGMIIHFIYI